MEIIAKISKGTKMDQIYLPKNRVGLSTGSYVTITALEKQKQTIKPYFYIKDLEPIKTGIIKRIFYIIDKLTKNYENIIITGSFLDKGFYFNDIDVIFASDDKISENQIKKTLENELKIKIHLIKLNNKDFKKGLETDPLYIMMLSRCVAKKRFIYKLKRKLYYKILDLHNLKSELLPINYDILTGNEKYYLTRNMIAISEFIENRKITKDIIDNKIEEIFNIKVKDLKNNIIKDKKEFIKKYKIIYNKTFNKIMEGVKNSSK
jgi:hypothetical protein